MTVWIMLTGFIVIAALMWPVENAGNLAKKVAALRLPSDPLHHKNKKHTLGIIGHISTAGKGIVIKSGYRGTPKRNAHIQRLLEYSGLSSEMTVIDFYGLIVGMSVLMILFSTACFFYYQGMMRYMALVFILIGPLWPDTWLREKAALRSWKIKRDMPFILNAIAVMAEAGMDLFQAIAETCKVRDGELVEEFNRMQREVRTGFSRRDALQRMSERTNVTELKIFLSALLQALEKGSSGVTELLRQQASELWLKRKNRAKELAEKASMKLFMPMLLLVMPALLIYLLAPAAFVLLDYLLN